MSICVVLILVLLSCRTKQITTPNLEEYSFVSFDFANEDFTQSPVPAIEYIQTQINMNSNFRVVLINVHNGKFLKDVNILKSDSYINVNSKTLEVSGTIRNEEKAYLIEQFNDKLNNLSQTIDDGLVFAGNYQKIYVFTDGAVKEFCTRKGIALFDIF